MTNVTIFENLSTLNDSSSTIEPNNIDISYGKAYPLVHVCLPYSAALIAVLSVTALIQLMTCFGIYQTSHKAILSIFNHFQIMEKAEEVQKKLIELEQTKRKEQKAAKKRGKQQQAQHVPQGDSSIELSVSSKSSGKSKFQFVTIDMSDEQPDCEDQKIFEYAVSRMRFKQVKTEEMHLPVEELYRAGVDASAFVIQDKVHQVINQQGTEEYGSGSHVSPSINLLDSTTGKNHHYIPSHGQNQSPEDVLFKRYLPMAGLSDYQTKLVQNWLRFLKFAKIVVLVLVVRMILRVGLIVWLFVLSVANINDQSVQSVQSVWDSLFTNLYMSSLAWGVWWLDYSVLFSILMEYKLLEPMSNFMKPITFSEQDMIVARRKAKNEQDPLNPFVIKCCKCSGCDKSYGFFKWYALMSCFIAVVLGVALVRGSDRTLYTTIVVCFWGISWVMYYVMFKIMSSKMRGSLLYRYAIPITLILNFATTFVMEIDMLHKGIKYDTICDNHTFGASWSHGAETFYLAMWILM